MELQNVIADPTGLYSGQILRPILYGDSVVGYADQQTGAIFSIIDLVEKRFTQIPEYGEDQQQQQQQDQQQLQQQEKQNRQQQQQQPPPSISNPTNSTRTTSNQTELAFLLDKSATQTFLTFALGVLLTGLLYNVFLLHFPEIESALSCPVQISSNEFHVSIVGVLRAVVCVFVGNPAPAVILLVWVPLLAVWFVQGFSVTEIQSTRSDLRVIDFGARIGKVADDNDDDNADGDVDVNEDDGDGLDYLAQQVDDETNRLMALIQTHTNRYQYTTSF